MVALVTASMFSFSTNGAFLPMNWLVNAALAHSCPKPGVWEEASIVKEVITPFSSVTPTPMYSPPNACTETHVAFSAVAGALNAALIASTTAVEVTVAPVSASAFSPRINGPLLSRNCHLKSPSSAHFVPIPGVCVDASINNHAMVSFPPCIIGCRRITLAVTSPPPNPVAVPTCTVKSSSIRSGVAAGFVISVVFVFRAIPHKERTAKRS